MEIKDYHIEMLSVGAADAFIIYIIDENNRGYLVLIDSGNYSDGQKIINHIRRYYDNPVINIAIVTHPDDDHYGGFVKMLEKIQDKEKDAIKIKKFWINDPGNNHIDKNEVKWIRKQGIINVKARSVYDLGDKNLIDLIDSLSICREEKFADVRIRRNYSTNTFYYTVLPAGFPGFTVIGPNKSYYEELIPDFRNELKYRIPDDDSNYDVSCDTLNDNCLSSVLDNANDDSSAHNQSSLMLLFEPIQGEKYFFMGDAGRAAFNKIHSYLKAKVKGVSWLKVPHHGSKHNIDSVMINWLKPKTAYISAEKIGNYVNQCTINALKRSGCKVFSTHIDATDFIHKQIGEREGYSTAEPL